jgi:O-antigen/teichoic acid export membrane protein
VSDASATPPAIANEAPDAAHAQGNSPSSRAPLGERAARAGMWSIGGYIAAQGLRLLSNLLLTRLLFAEAFGLMALVSVFLQGLALFSDIGAGPVIIQSKRGDQPDFLNTVFTVQVMRGAALWLLACIGAQPFALFYDQPILAAVLPIAGLNALASGFNSTKVFSANRRLSLARISVLEVVSQAVGIAGMVIWALLSPTVWALVCGGLLTAVAKAVLSHVILPGPNNRFHWDRGVANEMFSFGRWIFLSTALTFLGSQSDRLIFGKLVSLHTLGLYNIALMLATLPPSAFGRLANTVVLPVLSRAFEQGGDPTPAYHRARRPIMLAGGWLSSCMIAGGPLIIMVLYDHRFIPAGWMLRILAIGAWLAALEATVSPALVALGKPKWNAIGNGTKLVGILVFIPIGHAIGDFGGALLALAAADLVRVGVVWFGAYRLKLRDFKQDIVSTAMVALASGLGIAVLYATDQWLPPTRATRLVECVLVGTVVTAVWAPSGLSYWRERKRGAAPAVATA